MFLHSWAATERVHGDCFYLMILAIGSEQLGSDLLVGVQLIFWDDYNKHPSFALKQLETDFSAQ